MIKSEGFNRKGRIPVFPEYYDPHLSAGLASPILGDLLALESYHAFRAPAGEWAAANSGTNSAVAVTASEADRPGIVQCATGTTSAGRAGIRMGVGGVFLIDSGWNYRISTIMRVVLLSTAAEEFDVLGSGASDSIALAKMSGEGAGFVYDRDVDGVNWRCYSERGGTPDNDDSGIAVSANAWATLRLEILGTSAVNYYIDNVLVASQAGLTAGAALDAISNMIKSVGATSRVFDIDLMEFEARRI